MKRFDAVIFDMDGLLIDSEQLAMEAFEISCAHYQIEGLQDAVQSCIGTNAQKTREILTPLLEPTVSYSSFRAHWENHYQAAIHSDRLQTKPGAQYLLQHLADLGIPTGLATSSGKEKAIGKLERTGIRDYFSVIVGGNEVTHSKPHPEIYLKAAKQLCANPTECLALEDSENGVKAAYSAGMRVIQVPDLIAPSEQLRALGHLVLECLTQVPNVDFDRFEKPQPRANTVN